MTKLQSTEACPAGHPGGSGERRGNLPRCGVPLIQKLLPGSSLCLQLDYKFGSEQSVLEASFRVTACSPVRAGWGPMLLNAPDAA